MAIQHKFPSFLLGNSHIGALSLFKFMWLYCHNMDWSLLHPLPTAVLMKLCRNGGHLHLACCHVRSWYFLGSGFIFQNPSATFFDIELNKGTAIDLWQIPPLHLLSLVWPRQGSQQNNSSSSKTWAFKMFSDTSKNDNFKISVFTFHVLDH